MREVHLDLVPEPKRESNTHEGVVFNMFLVKVVCVLTKSGLKWIKQSVIYLSV